MIIVLATRGLREPEHSRQSRASHGGDWPPPLRSRWPPVPNYQEDKSVHRETLENLGRSPSSENNRDQLFGVGAFAHRGLPPFIGGLCGDYSPHRTTMTQTKRCPIFKFGSWWCAFQMAPPAHSRHHLCPRASSFSFLPSSRHSGP